MLNIFFIVFPIFIVIFLGKILKIVNIITSDFINSANKLVFSVCLPVLLFYKISSADINHILDWESIGIMYSAVVIVFIVTFILTKTPLIPYKSSSVFMMNSFRSNFAYMGLPVSYYAFGDVGLLNASVLMAFVVPFVNTLSIIALSIFSGNRSIKSFLKSTLLNPLAIASIVAIIFAAMEIQLYPFVNATLKIISGITLPLALFCIGASLDIKSFQGKLGVISLSILFKLFILPAVALLLIILFRDKLDIASKVLIILLASPSATVNYVLAASMGGDAEVTNTTIMMTTLLSIISYILWLSFMGM